MERPLIALSACLAGRKVRYDGGDRLDAYLVNTWGRHVDYAELCPEAGAGLGIPRESVKLIRRGGEIRAIGAETGADKTGAISEWCDAKLNELEKTGVSGFILKTKSPSCHGDASPDGEALEGILRRKIEARFPLHPVADEKTLQDPDGRDLFVTRLFTLMRWREMLASGSGRSGLVRFHTSHKLLFLSHSPEWYRKLGRIAASPESKADADRTAAYQSALLDLLKHPATRGRHANVLHHVASWFRKHGDDPDRREFAQAVDDYRRGLTSVAAPVALANHQTRKNPNPFLAAQTYLHPHPLEIALRG